MDKLTQLCIDQSGGEVTKESLVDTHQSQDKGSRITSSSTRTGGRVTHKTVNIVWGGDEEESVSKINAAVGWVGYIGAHKGLFGPFLLRLQCSTSYSVTPSKSAVMFLLLLLFKLLFPISLSVQICSLSINPCCLLSLLNTHYRIHFTESFFQ